MLLVLGGGFRGRRARRVDGRRPGNTGRGSAGAGQRIQGGGFSRVTAGAVLQGVCAGCGFRGRRERGGQPR